VIRDKSSHASRITLPYMIPLDDEIFIDDSKEDRKPGLMTKLVLLLLVLALLSTLVWPLLRIRFRGSPPPTPTPSFLQEA
jgi:hypothetical protein